MIDDVEGVVAAAMQISEGKSKSNNTTTQQHNNSFCRYEECVFLLFHFVGGKAVTKKQFHPPPSYPQKQGSSTSRPKTTLNLAILLNYSTKM